MNVFRKTVWFLVSVFALATFGLLAWNVARAAHCACPDKRTCPKRCSTALCPCDETASAKRPGAARGHCGCVNKARCSEPCHDCCGPRGYEDCFLHPSPTQESPK